MEFSDNYFDLCAGHEHVVEVRSPRPLNLRDLRLGHWLTEWM